MRVSEMDFDRHDLLDAFHAGVGTGAEIMLNHTGESLTPELQEEIVHEATGKFIEILRVILQKKGLRMEAKSGVN